jgi:hypothetical protein
MDLNHTCKENVYENIAGGDVTLEKVQAAFAQSFDASPLRRALLAHFTRYDGLLEPRVGSQKGDL